ncbi:hypothetical protein KJ969_01470 [Patescibacteria group bacterium]|nr:hypothetical protein [Patescibacteria group bacterium]MBU1921785.1 hypothetical protein [Patescibacteria group bacterium]
MVQKFLLAQKSERRSWYIIAQDCVIPIAILDEAEHKRWASLPGGPTHSLHRGDKIRLLGSLVGFGYEVQLGDEQGEHVWIKPRDMGKISVE